ncbi:MAG: DNA repair protein RecN [Chitinophagaceae bacterium]|nr:DNA repair protein RecN [Chitinophagaceae bacterium]
MLKRLFIQNYAIIDEVEIELSNGFSAITGETGAGKSILMGALGLILGERADSSVLSQKEKKLVVEGVFDTGTDQRVHQFLLAHELENEQELVLRREINPQGKSRAFINDSPVNLGQLQQISSLLVDLHQQFDTLQLGQEDFQREVLDALAGQFSLVEEYRLSYDQWVQARTLLQSYVDQKSSSDARAEYNKFQWEELEAAAFRTGELEELEAELKLLMHTEEVQQVFTRITSFLTEGEEPALAQLKSFLQSLAEFRDMHEAFPPLEDRLRSSYVELQDLSREFDKLSSNFGGDPKRLEWVSERLSLGYRLCKKHQVTTTAELLAIHAELATQLQQFLNIDQMIVQQQKEVNASEKKAVELASRISKGREKQIKGFEKRVHELLQRVGMPSAKIKVQLTAEQLGPHGSDAIEFLFDANNSGQFHPLRKVASGGELSRLMLCIKSLVGDSLKFSTQIFDEIDTGIAGEAARQVGLLLKELSASRQVICITHQPQIAGKAHTHFFVYKGKGSDPSGATRTFIRPLNSEERVQTIAQMIGGENPTPAALANARELLS